MQTGNIAEFHKKYKKDYKRVKTCKQKVRKLNAKLLTRIRTSKLKKQKFLKLFL